MWPVRPRRVPAMATDFPPLDGSAPKQQQFGEAPALGIDTSKRYTATLDTTLGEIVIALDAIKAPQTVNNFVFLALHHYYDGVIFHRIINGFMCQGGDPTGTGRGGPGYRFADELPTPGDYQLGSVAMANAGPNTNGSQFFIVSGRDGVSLPPLYSLFGQVVKGLEVVDEMQRVADRRRRPAEGGRRHQLGHDHRSGLTTARWPTSTDATPSSPVPAGASARRSPAPSTPPAPGSRSSPGPRPARGDGRRPGSRPGRDRRRPRLARRAAGGGRGGLDAFGGRLDVLVNNAGIGAAQGRPRARPCAELDELWNVNVRSALLAVAAALPAMLAAGTWLGRVDQLDLRPARRAPSGDLRRDEGRARRDDPFAGDGVRPARAALQLRRAGRRRDRDVAGQPRPARRRRRRARRDPDPAARRAPTRSPTRSCSSPPTRSRAITGEVLSADGGMHSTLNLWPTV